MSNNIGYTPKRYGEMVRVLNKPGEDILAEMTPAQAQLWHMVSGIVGEAGELLDAIKKHVIYQKPLDMDNVVEEFGDLEFYMEGARQVLDIARTTTLEDNLAKLSQRYPHWIYTNQAAIARADKIEVLADGPINLKDEDTLRYTTEQTRLDNERRLNGGYENCTGFRSYASSSNVCVCGRLAEEHV